MAMGLAIEALLRGKVEPVAGETAARATKGSSEKAVFRLERGVRLWTAKAQGPCWRVVGGVVALFQPEDGATPDAERFVMLAYGGDLVGIEAQLLGSYAFDAVALTTAALAPWNGTWGQTFPYVWHAQRTYEVAQLRLGSARKRLQRLRALLDATAPGSPWPRLRDIAAVTGLQVETVSRLLSRRRGTITALQQG